MLCWKDSSTIVLSYVPSVSFLKRKLPFNTLGDNFSVLELSSFSMWWNPQCNYRTHLGLNLVTWLLCKTLFRFTECQHANVGSAGCYITSSLWTSFLKGTVNAIYEKTPDDEINIGYFILICRKGLSFFLFNSTLCDNFKCYISANSDRYVSWSSRVVPNSFKAWN